MPKEQVSLERIGKGAGTRTGNWVLSVRRTKIEMTPEELAEMIRQLPEHALAQAGYYPPNQVGSDG